MKKELIICLAFLGLSVSSCVDHLEHKPFNDAIPTIESIYPEFAVRGSEIIIFGQNFGTDILENHVTINGIFTQITHVEPGRRVVAIVPNNLSAGENTLNLFAKGLYCSHTCFVVDDK